MNSSITTTEFTHEDSSPNTILIWKLSSLDWVYSLSFKIHYLSSSCVGTWHSAPHIYSILVPERGTPILIYYPGTGTWHPIHIVSWCRNGTPDPYILSWYRNVAPDPYSILVSERDTPILIYYPGPGTWHPIHILSWCGNVTLRSSYTILVPERGTRSPNLTTFVHQAFFYTKASWLTK